MTTPFYKRKGFITAAVIIAIPALAFAWWLFSPLLFDTEVNEEFPRAALAEVPDDMTESEVEAEMIEAEGEEVMAEDDMPEDATGGPVALATGQLMDADAFHKGSGDVTLYELEDGSRILRLEDIEVTNGPQLHVFISPSADDVMGEGYIDLGPLRGNIGSLNYDIPDGVEIPDEFVVVIYCVPFSVVFSTANVS